MTDWIDQLADGMNGDARRQHTKYQHDLLRDRLIGERAPGFFMALVHAMTQIAEELDAKVGGNFGGIKTTTTHTSIDVTSGNKQGSVSVRFNANGRTLGVHVHRPRGDRVPSYDRREDYHFNAATDGPGIWLQSEREQYREAGELASILLNEGFGRA
jgi:hypothetical protein